MFCDLVGSTGIAAQLDAEEWRDLVNAYLDDASAAVTEMGGHVAKKLGDGLMALFGYPLAHENDSERAARAALSIQRALADLSRKNAGAGKPELVARIGLEAGPAVVDTAGEIYGDVTNIAARVQALAEPGSVLITARVQRQVIPVRFKRPARVQHGSNYEAARVYRTNSRRGCHMAIRFRCAGGGADLSSGLLGAASAR
jgi:class 3 adenylate cyclase